MTGTVTLSMEVELGWGYHDLGNYDVLSEDRRAETKALNRLLSLCDELDIPFTFDVVGALFHERWPGSFDAPHVIDWFDSVPKTNLDRNPLFYAPDLVQRIQRAGTDHELSTHTFSHVLCDRVAPEVVAWELHRAREIHHEFDAPTPVSLVPPRHSPPPTEVLTAEGIEIFRTIGYERPSTPVEKLYRQFLDAPSPREPQLVDGVVETYCAPHTTLTAASLPSGQCSPHPIFHTLPTAVRQRIHERTLNRSVREAAEQDSYVHHWCHLHNMANDAQWKPIRKFLQTLAEKRDRGEVDVLTMADLNERVRKNASETDGETESARSVESETLRTHIPTSGEARAD